MQLLLHCLILGWGKTRNMAPFSTLKKIYFTEPPVCYNIFKSESPSCSIFVEELFSNPNYKNELAKYKKSAGIYYDSPEDFYYDWSALYCNILFLEDEHVLEIGIDNLLYKSRDFDEEER